MKSSTFLFIAAAMIGFRLLVALVFDLSMQLKVACFILACGWAFFGGVACYFEKQDDE